MHKSLPRTVDFPPSLRMLTNDMVVTTSTGIVFVLALPRAGAYEFDAALVMDNAALGGSRTATVTIAITPAPVRVSFARTYWRSLSTVPFPQANQTGASSPVNITMGSSVMRARIQAVGLIEVSAPSVVTFTAIQDAETCNIRAGSFARAQLRPT